MTALSPLQTFAQHLQMTNLCARTGLSILVDIRRNLAHRDAGGEAVHSICLGHSNNSRQIHSPFRFMDYNNFLAPNRVSTQI